MDFIYQGTAGPIVQIKDDIMVLCCHHVLLAGGKGDPGDPIGQLQGGTWTRVAHLYVQNSTVASADAAFAVLDNPDNWSNDIVGSSIHPRRIAEKSDIERMRDSETKVVKSGSVTSVTEGKIVETEAAVDVTYKLTGRTKRKVGQLKIRSNSNRAFSDEGDSGACLISEDGTVIGIVISGNPLTKESWATPMHVLRDQFHGLSLRTN
jgi:hypothetical protein